MNLLDIGKAAGQAKTTVACLDTNKKNEALCACAQALIDATDELIAQNAIDLKNGQEKSMPLPLQDRLKLTDKRIETMAEGIRQVAALPDPIGEVMDMTKRPNGLLIGKKRVPLGVVGIIYEARPNVTADAFALCFKTGNAMIFKGGSDAIHSNIAIARVLQETLRSCGLDPNIIQLIEDTSHETTRQLMQMNEYVDVLIPRGGAGLIRSVVKNSTVPVIETGTGNCHVYVDAGADIKMAIDIIINGKTQRVGVCNAVESIVVHRDIASDLLPILSEALREKGVEIRADKQALHYIKIGKEATEEDYGREYLDLIVSIKTVGSIDEAIAHINRYNTGHSEAIVTNNYAHAQTFLEQIDAACVYVNASTRFTDGFEFGFGAEIGISTQKLHARGPMGLNALTSSKYIIYGNGQIRK